MMDVEGDPQGQEQGQGQQGQGQGQEQGQIQDEAEELGCLWAEVTDDKHRSFFTHITGSRTWTMPDEYKKYLESFMPGWEVWSDKQRRMFYRNSTTGERQYHIPETFKSVIENVKRRQSEGVTLVTRTHGIEDPKLGEWDIKIHERRRKRYYINNVNQTTQWDAPLELRVRMDTMQAYFREHPLVDSTPSELKDEQETEPTEQQAEETEQIVEVQDAESSNQNLQPQSPGNTAMVLRELQEVLSRPDSVMNTDVMDYVHRYMQESDKKDASVIITRMLTESYRGYADMCGILQHLLLQTDPSLKQQQNYEEAKAQEELREQQHLADIIEKNFEVHKIDTAFVELNRAPPFLGPMMEDHFWRNFLIKMHSKHKDSTLMTYCLSQISKNGHYNEIAQHIQEADKFEVFRDVLVDMVARVPNASSSELRSLLEVLKRMCCSSEFMFMFAEELLLRIETKLDNFDQSNGNMPDLSSMQALHHANYPVAQQRFRRLREELEICAVWSKRTRTHGQLEPVAGFALKLTPIADHSLTQGHEALLTDVWGLLYTNDVDLQLLDRIFEYVAQEWSESASSDLSPDQLFKQKRAFRSADSRMLRILGHPQVLQLLTDAVFDPHKRSLSEKHLQRVCALLTIVSTSTAHASDESDQHHPSDHKLVFEHLVEAAKVVRGIDWSSLVLDWSGTAENLTSLMQVPAVSVCVIRWALCALSDTTFTSKAAYLSLASTLLHLLVTACRLHPLQRPAVFDALQLMVTMSDTSDQSDSGERGSRLMKTRKDSLECLVYLMSTGFSIPVMEFLTTAVTSFDQALVRHLVTSVSERVSAPFSTQFAEWVGNLLLIENVRKAMSKNVRVRQDVVKAFVMSVANSGHLNSAVAAKLDAMGRAMQDETRRAK